MTITLFTKDACIQCTATKKTLQRMGLPYAELRVDTPDSQGSAALHYVRGLGYASAPVVVIRDADGELINSWAGFQPEELQTLAA